MHRAVLAGRAASWAGRSFTTSCPWRALSETHILGLDEQVMLPWKAGKDGQPSPSLTRFATCNSMHAHDLLTRQPAHCMRRLTSGA